eukprot:TRINITY_DN1433_c0_g1_i1.p1 TRINITY_DN1433_c0_g1~~TRINITY_DN1433_c0_g1_i1.p1  ORF type:complete len:388 (+),score=55.43 TRINITY_DN1433_c0_g1_i1:815-1978(+)
MDTTVYCVDMHPSDGYSFIASSALGDVRLFDLRMIRAFHANSYVNIFKNWELPGEAHPVTGCAFSHDGSEVVATILSDYIYTFDTRKNFEQEYGLNGQKGEKLSSWAAARQSRQRIPKVPEEECAGLDASGVKIASLGRYLVENDFLGVRQSRTKRRSSGVDAEGTEAAAHLDLPEHSSSDAPVPKRTKGQDADADAMQVDAHSITLKPGSTSKAKKCDSDDDDDDGLADLRAILDADDNDLDDSSNADDDEEGEDGLPRKTYLRKYTGHVSSMTIKGCGFYGRRSEWVVSGSDDARVYFWNKGTGELFNVLAGHEDVVNCVAAAPNYPLLATSGIDNVVKLWEPVGRLSEKQELKRQKMIESLVEEHRDPYASERAVDVGSMCTQQ